MSAIERAYEKARARGARVVFPETDDPRILAAITRLRAERLAVPVPVEPYDDDLLEALMRVRGSSKENVARRMLERPLFRAAAMVTAGRADVMVAGATTATKRVLEAAIVGIGMAPGVARASSFFLMRFPDGRELIFSDCGVNIAPDAQVLGAIALASERTGERLLGSAKVAMLSFSTGESGAGLSVDMVREAAKATGFIGPIQGDAALNVATAQRKGLGDGQANVLIFPSLDAGNIAYKLCQELAGATALGPILQGFAKPVCDLSRGVSVDDIVAATAVTILLE